MFEFTDRFMISDKNVEFIRSAMMGPNAMRVSEELAYYLDIRPGMRVLDLGCGCGLSTLLLAEKCGATVFAADLWISPTENYRRFRSLGIDDKAIPVYVDVTKGLPFANGYFDVLFSVDAYHYFGDSAEMLPSLVPFVKRGGYIAVAVPGLKYEFGKDVPAEMRPFWNGEMERTLHSLGWWKGLWEGTEGIEMVSAREMDCCAKAWEEWLASHHPIAAEDMKMMEAEGGRYYNLVQLVAKVI